MIRLSSHNCIRAILIALCMALFAAAPVLVWDEVYADSPGQAMGQSDEQSPEQDDEGYGQDDRISEDTPVFGIYLIPGEKGDRFIEWLGDGQLAEDALLIVEKKEEMTDEELEQYNMIRDELIGNPEKDERKMLTRGSPDGTGIGEDIDMDGSDADGDGADPIPEGEEDKDVDGPGDEGIGNEGEDTDTDKSDLDDMTKAGVQTDGPTDAAQAKDATLTAPAQQTRDAGGTRDTIATGVFDGSRTGMILIVILVAFAAAIIIRRTRREGRYADDI